MTLTLTYDLDLQSPAIRHDLLVCRRSRSKIIRFERQENIQMDGQTDGGDCITWLTNAVNMWLTVWRSNKSVSTSKLNLDVITTPICQLTGGHSEEWRPPFFCHVQVLGKLWHCARPLQTDMEPSCRRKKESALFGTDSLFAVPVSPILHL